MLEGSSLSALVIGGGRVATRKVLGLLDSGARVHVVAPIVTPQLTQLVETNHDLRITLTHFSVELFGDAMLVVVATDDAEVNAVIAAQAVAQRRLVNVVTAPDQGNCTTPAVHRNGGVVVAVSAGRVPTAAARIRDRLSGLVDDRYAAAVRELSQLRGALLNQGARDRWTQATETLVGIDFCARVEAGDFDAQVAQWR